MDESRVWNIKNTWQKNNSARDSNGLTFLEGYLYNEQHLKVLIGIITSSYDFISLTPQGKTGYLQRLTLYLHNGVKPNSYNLSIFFSSIRDLPATILIYISSQGIVRYTDRMKRLFVTKFYHDRKDRNFLKGLVYVGEKPEIDQMGFNQLPVLGRKLYEYQINKNNKNLIKPIEINSKDLDWPFPEKFQESIAFTVSGFSFEFKNAPSNLKSKLNPPNDLTNIESGIKKQENNLHEALFHVNKKDIEEKMAEYIAIPTQNFVNESYFLYDNSNLSKKKTFVTDINKQLWLYGSFSYFSGKHQQQT